MKRGKGIYLISLVSVLWMNIIYVDYQMFFLLLMLLIIPILSGICMHISGKNLRFQLHTKSSLITQNQEIEVHPQMKGGRFLPLYDGSMTIEVRYSNDLHRVTKKLRYDRADNRKDWNNLSITPAYCGIVFIRLQKARVYDYLKIYSKKIGCGRELQIAVLPPLILGDGRSGAEGADGYQLTNDYRNLDHTEVIDLAEYMPGDQMNHIHWNLSLNHEEFIVKKFGSNTGYQNVILVDLTSGAGEADRRELDTIYQAACSIGKLYADAGARTAFMAWSAQAEDAVYLDFSNMEELVVAMVRLMKIECSEQAGEKMDERFVQGAVYTEEKPVFITRQSAETSDYQVVNIRQQNLKEVIRQMSVR